LKTNVPSEWKIVEVRQGERTTQVKVVRADDADYVLYQAVPNAEVVRLSRVVQGR
jgi:hypothetical protein